jgi:tetratricopeptide (TPR) repeat protein
VIRILRPACLAVLLGALLVAPAALNAQQQQGVERRADHLGRAKALIEKKRYKAALALFDSLMRAEPGSRDAVLGRAQMLAWLGRVSEALRAYERWVADHPKDVHAVVLFAQALSWAGRLDDAERLYKVLAVGGSPEAERGLARIAAWRGDLRESERRWREIVARRPGDSEAWVGLAQVLRWTNRPREARGALVRAVAADPTNRDAVEQLALVDALLAPHVDPTIASLEDTDGNRVMTMGATIALAAPWDGELAVRAQRRAAALGASRASSLSAALSAGRSIGRLTVRGSLGAARLGDQLAAPGSATRDLLTGSASASAAVGSRANVDVGMTRHPFDETAAIMQRGIATTTFAAGASIGLTLSITAAAEIEHSRLTGATPNTRVGGAGSLRWRAPHVLSLLATVRTFGYDSDPGEGYFAPRRYLLGEAGAQLAIGGELGWSATLGGGIGAQAIHLRGAGSETQPAARGALGIVYRPTPRLEWAASGHLANAASPATSTFTSYRANGWTLRGRVSF